MDLLTHLRAQSHANRLANRRLLGAVAALPAAEFHAPRTGYFPSLAATLNHILEVDQFYIGALHGEPQLSTHWERFVASDTVQALAARQDESDLRLVAWCEAAGAAALDRVVEMPRSDRIDRDIAARVLAHLFMHQTHHRGQAHAMLSGTAVAPPQLDEFLLASDARFRTDDLLSAGWTEFVVLGGQA
ncbi:DinB family protein [Caldimonas sp. KR1-144]|uniref:DinB family protein n=1 Tax=Caldimonas sp. KR1-144 TaxID=3400911 RepID=UPI003C0EE62E